MARRKVSERSVRLTIGMMRSIASHVPISPFHLEAANQMEKMLEELLELRKRKWAGLTDEELSVAIADAWGQRLTRYYQYAAFYKDVEAKLKEKNNG